ncbi:MAG: wax ester/triacylglycerol synthase family O-acyltransferase [Myxococcales bacterium]|nr:wax ester/triacylglycerol synthase family O-acyltransferase [Myxococcales bacterium]
MQQLTAMDAAFLNMETASTFGHVASLNLFEGAGFSQGRAYPEIREHIASRIDLLPPFRRRLVEVPFGLDLPYWVVDPSFDLDFHIRHIAVPPPGEDRQLAELTARIIGRPLDRSKPLWELYVIEGLASGDVALLFKIHHATIDGKSGMELWHTLFDTSPDAEAPQPPEDLEAPEPIPPPWELLSRSYASMMFRPAQFAVAQRNAFEAMSAFFLGRRGAVASVFGALEDAWGLPSGDLVNVGSSPAPPTPFNRAITPHRRVSWCEISLPEIKRIKNAFGVTLNDVVMAICGGAMRRYLARHDALPSRPLLAMVPFSIRTGDESETYSNRVSGMTAEIATDEADPRKRLERCSRAMAGAKEVHSALPAEVLQDFARFAPPAVAAQASRMVAGLRLADRVDMPANLVISNVPGPREALYSAGARLKAMIPVSTIGDGMGLNITVVSYRDRMDFGFVACRELAPDVWDIAEDTIVAHAELLDAAGEEPKIPS